MRCWGCFLLVLGPCRTWPQPLISVLGWAPVGILRAAMPCQRRSEIACSKTRRSRRSTWRGDTSLRLHSPFGSRFLRRVQAVSQRFGSYLMLRFWPRLRLAFSNQMFCVVDSLICTPPHPDGVDLGLCRLGRIGAKDRWFGPFLPPVPKSAT